MTDLLALTILTALFTAGLLFCFTKWGWIGWYQAYRKKWMPPGDCYFCMSFWLAIWIHGLYQIAVMPEPFWLPLPTLWDVLATIAVVFGALCSAALSALVCSVIIGTSEG